jgi:hypothetical protein
MDETPRHNKNRAPHPVIRASEIGTYVYCRRAWWLKRVAGFEPQGRAEILAGGIEAHAQHGRTVRRSQWQRRVALICLLLGFLLLALAGVSLFFIH